MPGLTFRANTQLPGRHAEVLHLEFSANMETGFPDGFSDYGKVPAVIRITQPNGMGRTQALPFAFDKLCRFAQEALVLGVV